ncbi:DUF4432 family protein [Acetobacteraceae bacterium KSS8]|uniref:DUF4432 family protein n=1 Tax=Endosaccharibacter trunci TaxID=2812733 RepID=A0ABT1W2G1_9PROT|nr:DUF4432 family protein [Acetobacteraceae bacterium KSS8]
MAEADDASVRASVPLRPDAPDGLVLRAGALAASLFRYPGGVRGLILSNPRGSVTVLPWMGQMVWDASFDGVRLGMRSLFDEPVAGARTIGETYGCLAFHSGLLRNGVPGPRDDHAAHGEFPCAAMNDAAIEILDGPDGIALRLVGERVHTEGFGPAYAARPSVTLGADATCFAFAMSVRNRSARPMPLMYMAHVNPGFVENGRIVQPAPWTPAHVRVRRAVPRHVEPNPAYLARIEAFGAEPSLSRTLSDSSAFEPEQVFYLSGLRTDEAGRTTQLLRSPEGWAFSLSHRPEMFPHCVRWLMRDGDAAVAAIALPSTCEPEGYEAELAKGNVRFLPPGEDARFAVEIGFLDAEAAGRAEAAIASRAERGAEACPE